MKFQLTKEMKTLLLILVAGLFFGLLFADTTSRIYMLEGFAGVDNMAQVPNSNVKLNDKFATGSVSINQALGIAKPF
jgi:hypothetical protein